VVREQLEREFMVGQLVVREQLEREFMVGQLVVGQLVVRQQLEHGRVVLVSQGAGVRRTGHATAGWSRG